MSSFLSLLLAVTTLAQDSIAPPARPARKHRHPPVIAIEPMTVAIPALQSAATALVMAQPQLEANAAQAPLMAAQAPMMTLQAPVLALAAQELQLGVAALETTPVLEDWDWDQGDQGDTADSLYRVGRRALNRNRYQEAITAFGQIISRYPQSSAAPDAVYWSSFALYRTGDTKNLQAAVELLAKLRANYPDASMRDDAESLAARIDGVLAQRGDAPAAERNQARADSARSSKSRSSTASRERGRSRSGEQAPTGCEGYGEDDPRLIALNALLQMNAENAIPILRDVLKRRDPCSVIMRRKALFIVSQKRSAETAQILLDAVRSDPDQEVREQGVFWLSQVPGEETVAALDSILRASTDANVQDKAIFALSQHNSARAGGILRAYAERRDAPSELREKAIFWLGQRRSQENADFLRGLYAKLESDELKDKVLFSVSQMGGSDNYRFLMDIALNQNENIELRKKALFWAGQGRNVDMADLVRLYDSMKDREMREQLVFVYSQRRDPAALDKLFDIAKNDPDRELRKKAIFWIGQSRDPRAARFLQELINQ